MDKAKVLLRVSIDPTRHRPTGFTEHYVDMAPIPVPTELQIVTFGPPDPGFYLLYLDSAGNELTDTFHDTVGDALLQAEREFGVRSSDWVPAVELH